MCCTWLFSEETSAASSRRAGALYCRTLYLNSRVHIYTLIDFCDILVKCLHPYTYIYKCGTHGGEALAAQLLMNTKEIDFSYFHPLAVALQRRWDRRNETNQLRITKHIKLNKSSTGILGKSEKHDPSPERYAVISAHLEKQFCMHVIFTGAYMQM